MNKRQAKKLYKKIHGCNPPEGRIPAVLLKNPGKAKQSGGIRRMPEVALEAPACFSHRQEEEKHMKISHLMTTK